MSSLKLNKVIIDRIAGRLMAERFAPLYRAVSDDFARLAMDVYNDVYPEKDRAIMASLRFGWLGERNFVPVRFGDSSRIERLYYAGKCDCQPMKYIDLADHIKLPHPACHSNYAPSKTYLKDAPLAVRYFSLRKRLGEVNAEEEDAKRKLVSALQQFRTLSGLRSGWPEMQPYTEDLMGGAIPNLPAVLVSDINKMFNLHP